LKGKELAKRSFCVIVLFDLIFAVACVIRFLETDCRLYRAAGHELTPLVAMFRPQPKCIAG